MYTQETCLNSSILIYVSQEHQQEREEKRSEKDIWRNNGWKLKKFDKEPEPSDQDAQWTQSSINREIHT